MSSHARRDCEPAVLAADVVQEKQASSWMMNRIKVLPVESLPMRPKVFKQLLGAEHNKHQLMRNIHQINNG